LSSALPLRDHSLKETVDEVIFRTSNKRNRLILELMARGGMRIGEVLNLRPCDIEGGRIVIQSPKSGRQAEIAFIPQDSRALHLKLFAVPSAFMTFYEVIIVDST
jgi:integrase